MESKASAFVLGLALCSPVCSRYQPLPEYFTDPRNRETARISTLVHVSVIFSQSIVHTAPPIFLTGSFLCFPVSYHHKYYEHCSDRPGHQHYYTKLGPRIVYKLRRLSCIVKTLVAAYRSRYFLATQFTEAGKFTELVVSLVIDSILAIHQTQLIDKSASPTVLDSSFILFFSRSKDG